MSEAKTQRGSRPIRSGAALCAGLAFLLTASNALGQELAGPTIESVGEAMVGVAPSAVSFELQAINSGASSVASTESTLAFEERLASALADLDLNPTNLTVSGVHFPASAQKGTGVVAGLRFALSSEADGKERATEVASLVDRLRKAAGSLRSDIRGPLMEVDDREVFEQEAIARATENALYKADAAAKLMKAEIYAVNSIRVGAIEWKRGAIEDDEDWGDASRIVCRAAVTIVYAYRSR